MGKSKHHILRLGLLVTTGLLLFIVGVYYLGSKDNLFSSSITVKSYFNDVNGLSEGSKVRFSGIDVGVISDIEIVSDTIILVEMDIVQKIKQFIKKDSKVKIVREGIMGSQFVQIYPGSPGGSMIEEDDILVSIRAIRINDILMEAQGIIRDGRQFSTMLMEISTKISQGEGDLAILLNENNITTKLNIAGDELVAVSQNLNDIVSKVNNGDGDLGRLINDTTISHNFVHTMKNIDSIAARADTITRELQLFGAELNNGNGLITRLVYDSIMADNVDDAITNVNVGIDEVVATAESVRESWLLNLFSGKNKKKNKEKK